MLGTCNWLQHILNYYISFRSETASGGAHGFWVVCNRLLFSCWSISHSYDGGGIADLWLPRWRYHWTEAEVTKGSHWKGIALLHEFQSSQRQQQRQLFNNSFRSHIDPFHILGIFYGHSFAVIRFKILNKLQLNNRAYIIIIFIHSCSFRHQRLPHAVCTGIQVQCLHHIMLKPFLQHLRLRLSPRQQQVKSRKRRSRKGIFAIMFCFLNVWVTLRIFSL